MIFLNMQHYRPDAAMDAPEMCDPALGEDDEVLGMKLLRGN